MLPNATAPARVHPGTRVVHAHYLPPGDLRDRHECQRVDFEHTKRSVGYAPWRVAALSWRRLRKMEISGKLVTRRARAITANHERRLQSMALYAFDGTGNEDKRGTDNDSNVLLFFQG